MKKILTISLFILMIFFTACNRTPDIEPIGFTYGDIDFTNEAEFFDLERKSMPSEDQIHSIKKGMSMKDIIYALGRPHNMGPFIFGKLTLDWYTENGAICRVSLDYVNDSNPIWENVYNDSEALSVDIVPPISATDVTTLGVIWDGEKIPYEEFFDKEQKNIPTYEQTMRITNGMSIKDVISLIGRPHNYGPTSGFITYEWYLDNNTVFRIHVAYHSSEWKTSPEAEYYDGFVDGLFSYSLKN